MIQRIGGMIAGKSVGAQLPDGSYGRAVPEPFHGGIIDRFHDALAVLLGSAYAIRWPTAKELNDALRRE